jgi:hypothetical protein
MLAMIAADVAAGIIPWDVPDASALHDFVDGNLYGLDLFAELTGDPDYVPSDAEDNWLNKVANYLDILLCGSPRGSAWRQENPESYSAWLAETKYGLREARAAAFGLTHDPITRHDAS